MESLLVVKQQKDVENYGAVEPETNDEITSEVGSVVESWVDNVKEYALTGGQMGVSEFEGCVKTVPASCDPHI